MIRPFQPWSRWLVLLAGVAMALVGCAGTNTHYACAGYPSRPLCLPPSAIYALTNGAGTALTAESRPGTLGGRVVQDWDQGLPRGHRRPTTGASP